MSKSSTYTDVQRFSSVAEMDKFFEEEGGWKEAMKQVLRPLKVKHYKKELTIKIHDRRN